MIPFLNANQGAVMALLTGVYVLATIILVLLAQRQAKIGRQALDLNAKAERAKYRPYVIFDIVYEEVVAYARLKNIGVSPALDVRIAITPRLHWKVEPEGVGFIEKGVSFLAPSRELSEPFGWMGEFFAQYPELKFAGSVSYKDAEGGAYTEEFSIDLAYLKNMKSIGKKDIGEELEGIKKALEKFHASSFRPLIRTITEKENRQETEAMIEEFRRQRGEQLKNKPASGS